MKRTTTIDINKRHGIQYTKFPDGQPHIKINHTAPDCSYCVICSIKSAEDLLLLCMVADAIEGSFGEKLELHIPYLMGARYDRVMHDGDSFDLRVISRIINSLGFKKVVLYDVHSDVSTALINNSVNTTAHSLHLNKHIHKDSVLISPDSGSAKKASEYMQINPFLSDLVFCVKNRDLSSGKISLKVLEPEKCLDRHCVIIDDICDGGGTFLAIADQIKPKSLTLIVTHGIFSKGIDVLLGKFDTIITSDSYQEIDNPQVKQIKVHDEY